MHFSRELQDGLIVAVCCNAFNQLTTTNLGNIRQFNSNGPRSKYNGELHCYSVTGLISISIII